MHVLNNEDEPVSFACARSRFPFHLAHAQRAGCTLGSRALPLNTMPRVFFSVFVSLIQSALCCGFLRKVFWCLFWQTSCRVRRRENRHRTLYTAMIWNGGLGIVTIHSRFNGRSNRSSTQDSCQLFARARRVRKKTQTLYWFCAANANGIPSGARAVAYHSLIHIMYMLYAACAIGIGMRARVHGFVCGPPHIMTGDGGGGGSSVTLGCHHSLPWPLRTPRSPADRLNEIPVVFRVRARARAFARRVSAM